MTDKYAVIGNPIAHSKSPLIHRMFAEQTGQDISYEAMLAPHDSFAATIKRLRAEGYKGCNITVPFKFEAFELATRLDPLAAIAQAVNTLKFHNDEIMGYNTDGLGLADDIRFNLKISLKNKSILLMGAGGAASGVIHSLATMGRRIIIANRSVEKAQILAARNPFSSHPANDNAKKNYTVPPVALSYADLAGQQFDIVINATSASLSDSAIPLPPTIFAPGALAYDMMYGRDTPFMAFAREQGAAVVADGLGMLVEQAAEAFYLWRGVRPDTAAVLKKLRA